MSGRYRAIRETLAAVAYWVQLMEIAYLEDDLLPPLTPEEKAEKAMIQRLKDALAYFPR